MSLILCLPYGRNVRLPATLSHKAKNYSEKASAEIGGKVELRQNLEGILPPNTHHDNDIYCVRFSLTTRQLNELLFNLSILDKYLVQRPYS